MKYIVHKIFYDYEKEERWLNSMAAQGYNLVDYSFFARYTFKKGKPCEYTYRLELLRKSPRDPESLAYLEFMEEAGVECVCTYISWVYFRKKTAGGPFEIYTDNTSRAGHYKRVFRFLGVVFALNLFAGLLNLLLGTVLKDYKGIGFNAFVAPVNLTIAIGLAPLLMSYVNKIKFLEKEKHIRE